MKTVHLMLNSALALAMGLNPLFAMAAPPAGSVPDRGSAQEGSLPLDTLVPSVPGLTPSDISLANDIEPLARTLDQIAQEHANEANRAGVSIKAIRGRSVGEYFPSNVVQGSREWREGVDRLVADATKLHNYFESVSNPQSAVEIGLKKDFVKQKLEPFIRAITRDQLESSLHKTRIAQPVQEWSVETLVVTQQVTFVARFPNFTKNAMGLVSGKHLRGATAAAGSIVMLAVIGYTGTHLGIEWGAVSLVSLGFVGRSLLGGFNAGTVGPIMSALTGWGVRPTTERINKWNARITGRLEERINLGYDRAENWFQRSFQGGTKAQAPNSEQNHTPNFASVAEDGFGIAGMTEDQQTRNWTKNLRMWVTVAKRFSQLLSDTYHHGRVLMMIAWHDEQAAAAIVETIDTKLQVISSASEALLDPYKTAILANHALSADDRRIALERLEGAYDDYLKAEEAVWREPQDRATMVALIAGADAARDNLVSFGLTKRDIRKMGYLQLKYARAVRSLVTGVAINEIRSFMTAEANRNLESESRRAVRAVRRGFGLQFYTDRYLLLVQERIREMGYEIGAAPGGQCSALFTSAR